MTSKHVTSLQTSASQSSSARHSLSLRMFCGPRLRQIPKSKQIWTDTRSKAFLISKSSSRFPCWYKSLRGNSQIQCRNTIQDITDFSPRQNTLRLITNQSKPKITSRMFPDIEGSGKHRTFFHRRYNVSFLGFSFTKRDHTRINRHRPKRSFRSSIHGAEISKFNHGNDVLQKSLESTFHFG